MRRYPLYFFLLLVLCAGSGTARAQETALSEADQFPVLCKLLSFETGRIPFVGDTIKFAVLTDPGYRPSVHTRDELYLAAVDCPFKYVGQRLIVLQDLEYDKTNDWQTAALNAGVDVLYIAPQSTSNLRELIAFTRAHGIISMTGVEEYVRDGVALGVGLESDRPKLLLNDVGAEAEGVELRGHVPRLARRYK